MMAEMVAVGEEFKVHERGAELSVPCVWGAVVEPHLSLFLKRGNHKRSQTERWYFA
jgi:hypothetical protein